MKRRGVNARFTGVRGLEDGQRRAHLKAMEQMYLILSVAGFVGLNAVAYNLRPTCPQDRPDERPQRRN